MKVNHAGYDNFVRCPTEYCYYIRTSLTQGAKDRMVETKTRLAELMGPVLGLVEKQAPNQVTGRFTLVFDKEGRWECHSKNIKQNCSSHFLYIQ